MQKALAKLYSPQITTDSWDSVQRDITSLLAELGSWAEAAHVAGLSAKSALEEGVDRHNLLLAFHYQSTRLLICRPCLCRLKRRKGQINASAHFNTQIAEACVAAANAIAWLLPNEPDRAFFYEQTPWWSIVHIIMQAVAVFLLKMSFGPMYSTHKSEELPRNVKKLIRWLRHLSPTSDVAGRAYNVTVDIIKTSESRSQTDMATPTKKEPIAKSGRQSMTMSTSPFAPFPHDTSTAQPEAAYPSSLQTEWDQLHQPTAATTASSMSFLPEGSKYRVSSPAQYSTMEMDTIRMQNLNAFRAQQAQGFDNFQFDPNLALDTGLPVPLVFGNPFVTNFDPPGMLFNDHYTSEQIYPDKAFHTHINTMRNI